MAHNERGEEILDPTPVSIPLNFKRPVPLNERIKQMVRDEASLLARENGYETFDEADDFDTDDDLPDPRSPWEENFDPDAPFISAREAEIRHGQVKDFDHSKIDRGVEEIKKYHKKPEEIKKPKAKPAAAADAEGDEAE